MLWLLVASRTGYYFSYPNSSPPKKKIYRIFQDITFRTPIRTQKKKKNWGTNWGTKSSILSY